MNHVCTVPVVARPPTDAACTPSLRGPRRCARGVSLIELMVGLLIGLLAVLVISQVLFAVEGQKRTTTSGADAQLTGTLALYTLQRELEMAGYGLTTSQLGLGCTIRSLNFTATNGGANRPLAPVIITNGASVAPDTIRIFSSSKPSFSVPTRVSSDHPLSGAGVTEFGVNNTIGVVAGTATVTGDLMIAVPAAPDATNTCTVFRANGTGSVAGATIAHNSGGTDTGAWNGPAQANLLALFPAAGYPAGSYLVNLGAGLVDRTYSIVSGNLQLAEFDTPTRTLVTNDLFPQVANLQAYYGKDTTGDGSIDSYDTVTPTTPAGWAQVIAVRVAVVVRSTQYEKDEVTTAAPVWDLGSTPTVTDTSKVTCGTSQCLSIPVDGVTDWKHYRYKLYDTVVPLRNLVWRS